jgi:hypothetical protein
MADSTRLNSFFWGDVNPSAGVTSWFEPAAPSSPTPPNIVTLVLPLWRAGIAQSFALSVDGTGPFTWSLSPGSPALPSGITFSSAGVLSGTAAAAYSADIIVRVEGAAGADLRDTQVLALTVLAADEPLPPDPPGLPGELPQPPAPTQWVRLPRDVEVWIRVPRDES